MICRHVKHDTIYIPSSETFEGTYILSGDVALVHGGGSMGIETIAGDADVGRVDGKGREMCPMGDFVEKADVLKLSHQKRE